MTSMETISTRSIDASIIVKLFAKFRSRYGQLWTSRAKVDEDWEFIIEDWLEELLPFDLETVRQAVKEALMQHKEYPPTLGQLVDLCLKATGVPGEDQIINLMVQREFNHPLVKLVYDKIGSWQLKNGKSEEIRAKVKSVYADCLNKFTAEPESQWAQLNIVKEQLSLPPVEHPKIPSQEERRGFKERLDEAKKLAEEGRATLKNMNPPEFDEKKIRPEGEQYDDYCKYLLSVPEHLVLGLSPKYAYDRQRLLNMKDTARHLKEVGYIHPKDRIEDEAPRNTGGKPTRMYKNWSD